MLKVHRTRVAKLVVALLFISYGFSFSFQPVSATTSTNQKGLTLSPLRSEFEIAPGTSLDGTLTVSNSSTQSMKVTLTAEAFSVINQQYDYAFTAESNVAKWVTFSQSEANLVAGQSDKIQFSVGVPLSAEPGGRYISLFASTETGTQFDGINSRQRIASLLYITVLGDVSRSGHMVSLSSPWLVGDKAEWNVAIQNTGSTHFRSRYSADIQNIFGGNETSKQGEALILPGTVRLVSDTVSLPNFPGIYKVIFNIGLGDTPAVVVSRYIIYIPVLSVVVFVFLAIAATAIFWLRKPIKNKKD